MSCAHRVTIRRRIGLSSNRGPQPKRFGKEQPHDRTREVLTRVSRRRHAGGLWSREHSNGSVRPNIVSERHLARHGDYSSQSWRSKRPATVDWRYDVDVRSGAADEHAIAASDSAFDASMVDDGHD